MEYSDWNGPNGYDQFENNGFLTSLVEDDQTYHQNNFQPTSVVNVEPGYNSFPSQPDASNPPQLNAQFAPYPEQQQIVGQSFPCAHEIGTTRGHNDESLYSLLHAGEENQNYWSQNSYQTSSTNQFYYQSDPYQQGYSQSAAYSEEYNYWEFRHYPFQSGQGYSEYLAQYQASGQEAHYVHHQPFYSQRQESLNRC
jgi:hypothetical protein